MLDHLEVLGGDAVGSWCEGEVMLGRAYLQEPGALVESPIVRVHGCSIVLDGRLTNAVVDGEKQPDTDSATIVESYVRWGDSCARHLEGEFAFALWDHARNRLFCASDVMGRRTLAYYWDGYHFLASTRATALLFDPRVPKSIDGVFLAHALSGMWAQPAGHTAFCAIRRLRPGYALTLDGPRLVERQADILRLDRPAKNAPLEDVQNEFWTLLDDSARKHTKDRDRTCILLSGGLDSSCVAASVARTGAGTKAFSFLSADRDSVDEQRSIEALLLKYPSLVWRRVEATNTPAFAESAEELPVCDDPVLNAATFLASRIRTWRAMRATGHDSFVDGEGGDEIFDVAMRPGDLFSAQAWTAIARYVAKQKARSGTLWRRLCVPRLRGRPLHAWAARERRIIDPIPPWFTTKFRQSPEVQQAFREQEEWYRRDTFASCLPAMLENAPQVGTHAAMRLLTRSCKLSSSSPFLSRRIVEFAARAPADYRLDPIHRKYLLRCAAAGILPDEVRWRPKRNGLYERLLSEELASSEAQKLLHTVTSIRGLREHIDPRPAAVMLASARAGSRLYSPVLQSKMRALLAVAAWWRRLEGALGKCLTLG